MAVTKSEIISFINQKITDLGSVKEELDRACNIINDNTGFLDDNKALVHAMHYEMSIITERLENLISKTNEIQNIIESDSANVLQLPNYSTDGDLADRGYPSTTNN